MNVVFNLVRASIFLVLASFASTTLAVTVSSEGGGASLDGGWSHGCSFDDENEFAGTDYQEFLVYQGNTVEARFYLYTSDDESCSGSIFGVESEGPFAIVIEDDPVQIEGWLGEDEFGDTVPVDPPPSQGDPLVLLNPTPLASVEIFKIPGEGDEVGCAYIDDTDQSQNGLNWYLYRCAGEDDATYIPFLDTEEPLIKAELPVVGVIPVPAGIWLFGTALIGFVGYSRRRKIG